MPKSFFYLLGILFILTTGSSEAGPASPISQDELLKKSAEVTLLDVRSPAEFKAGHIEGAKHIEYTKLAQSLAELPDKSAPIVVYCRSGRRAATAIEVLHKSGYTNIYHLTGDMNGWLENKRPVVTPKN